MNLGRLHKQKIRFLSEEEWAPIELRIRKQFNPKDPTPIICVELVGDEGRFTAVRASYRKQFFERTMNN